MIDYRYTARNPQTGQQVKASVQADSEEAAAKLIRKEGLTPIDIRSTAGGFGQITDKLSHIKSKEKVLFSRQLATLINAGLPLVQSLRSVNDQTTSKPFRVIIAGIITDVEAGATLSNSMAKYPKVFNRVYISLVAAGETSGTLDAALSRLAIQQEKDADLVSKIRGALAYPIIVIFVMLLVVGFMLVKVLPQVQTLYAGLPGAQLPLETRLLLDVSHAVIKYWWIVIILVIVFVIGSSRWIKTGLGRSVFDSLKMHIWPIGPLIKKMYMARFARTATTLVASGVPIIQVLEITADAVNNVHITASINKAIEKVKGGKALSDSIQGDPNFLVLVPNMLRIGEQSGSMEQMLDKTAEYFEKEVDDQVKAISTLIEPVLMVILGVVAFIIVAAVLLPIYALAGQSFTSG